VNPPHKSCCKTNPDGISFPNAFFVEMKMPIHTCLNAGLWTVVCLYLGREINGRNNWEEFSQREIFTVWFL